MPQRNGRPRPVARVAREVVAGEMARRRMVAWLRTEVSMRCSSRLPDMMGRSGMFRRTWLGCGSRNMRRPRLLGYAWPGRRSHRLRSPRMLGRTWLDCRSRELRCPRMLGRSYRASVAATVSAFRCSERRSAECRAGDSDECEFHEVVVHSTPSLSVSYLTGEFISPLHQARNPRHPFLTRNRLSSKAIV